MAARRDVVALLQSGVHVHIAWFPSHEGVAPNEAAYAAANLARTQGDRNVSNLPHPPPHSGISVNVAVAEDDELALWLLEQQGRAGPGPRQQCQPNI